MIGVMTKPRTFNPAVRIEGYTDAGELFIGTRLDTAEPVAVRLTANSRSQRRPGYAMFKKGAKDPKMKTPPGGVLQFDSCRPVLADGKPEMREGRPLCESTWATLLTKDTDEHPVLAARPARLVEIAGEGANGQKLAFADIAEPALRETFAARTDGLAACLAGLARRPIVPGDVEDRSRFVLVQSVDREKGFGRIFGMPELGEAAAVLSSFDIEAVPVVRVFVGTVAKENKRRIAPFAQFLVPGATTEAGYPAAGFVRCNVVLGRHRLDAKENEIPEETAQRFMTACTFAEFPEPALPGSVDLGRVDPATSR